MAKIVEMDEWVTISAQWEENVGPVILINKFSVNPEDFDQFLKAWAAEAGRFKEQPGSFLHNYTGVSVGAVSS
jgi:hypothetical protein